jgi:hypothetical protein
MGFEKFEKHSGRGSGNQPKISLRKSESIGINGVAVEQYFGDSDGAILYYNEEENQVGIQPCDKNEDSDAYSLQFNTNSNGANINAASFLKQHSLTPSQTTQYNAHWNEEQELAYIDLNEEGTTYGNE